MVSYRIDPASGVVEIVGEPTGHADEVRQLFHQIVTDPAYRRGFGFLRNRGSLEPLSTPSVRALAEALASVAGFDGTSWAIVAADPVNFGTMRMLEVFTQAHRVELKVFTNDLDARQWLAARTKPSDENQPR